MKPFRILAVAVGGATLGAAAAAATLPSGGSAPAGQAEPRTVVVHETVHRTRHVSPRRASAAREPAGTAIPAAQAAIPAPANRVVTTRSSTTGRHGDDDHGEHEYEHDDHGEQEDD